MPGQEWADAVYRDKSLVTRISPLHADQAAKQDQPDGRPTSSSTMPGLVVSMYRHAMIVPRQHSLPSENTPSQRQLFLEQIC